MSLSDFVASPWARSHPAYRGAALSIVPAPENSNSEVLLAGLYRSIGMADVPESAVSANGRELDRAIAKARDTGKKPEGTALDGEAVHSLLHAVLQSPKSRQQSSKRFLQVTPLVGETTWFSGSARLVGNPWPAGTLVRRMIWLGSPSQAAAQALWRELFAALDVNDTDDVFARFLNSELAAWSGQTWGAECAMPPESEVPLIPADELSGMPFPARQFVRDLPAVIAAKPLMTRRQWTSILEALIRIAAVAHVAWLCEVQHRTWGILRRALANRIDPEPLVKQLYPSELVYLTFGTEVMGELKDRTSTYLRARLGINAVLWALEDAGAPHDGGLHCAADIDRLKAKVVAHRAALGEVLDRLDELAESEMRTLLCAKGIGNNILEFARYVLYQRAPADPTFRGYDQGYVVRKKGASKAARWICAPGPLALLTLVHCSLDGVAGPRSVHRLAEHMSSYGIAVDHRDIANNDLGHQLRMLGLVLDSPDAETGMLLVPPFQTKAGAPTS